MTSSTDSLATCWSHWWAGDKWHTRPQIFIQFARHIDEILAISWCFWLRRLLGLVTVTGYEFTYLYSSKNDVKPVSCKTNSATPCPCANIFTTYRTLCSGIIASCAHCSVYGFVRCRRDSAGINTLSSSSAACRQRTLRGNAVHQHQQLMMMRMMIMMVEM